MKALILENKVVQIEEQAFDVAQPLEWVDIPNGVSVNVGDTYKNNTFSKSLGEYDNLSLPQAIENKLAELEKAYDDARANTFVSYNGNQFGIKEKTIANFNALWAFGKKKEDDGSPLEGYPFTDKAGERVVMTKQQFSDLIDDAFEAVVVLDTKEATMAQEIRNLTSVEDIANYTITFS